MAGGRKTQIMKAKKNIWRRFNIAKTGVVKWRRRGSLASITETGETCIVAMAKMGRGEISAETMKRRQRKRGAESAGIENGENVIKSARMAKCLKKSVARRKRAKYRNKRRNEEENRK